MSAGWRCTRASRLRAARCRVHHTPTYGPGLSRVRTAQASALARFVTQHAADCAYPRVVTGDLNAEPGSDELRLWAAAD